MRAWSASAINSYYLDPLITFLTAGQKEARGSAIVIEGYYVTPHCEPDCCAAFGNISRGEIGPFRSAGEARQWSRDNLAEVP